MYKIAVIVESSTWDKEAHRFVITREEVASFELETERQYRRLLKQAKTSWRTSLSGRELLPPDAWENDASPEYRQHDAACLLITEPDANGVFVEKKLQYTRLPYPHQRAHQWLVVSDWRDDAEAWKMTWDDSWKAWQEAVARGDIRPDDTGKNGNQRD